MGLPFQSSACAFFVRADAARGVVETRTDDDAEEGPLHVDRFDLAFGAFKRLAEGFVATRGDVAVVGLERLLHLGGIGSVVRGKGFDRVEAEHRAVETVETVQRTSQRD